MNWTIRYHLILVYTIRKGGKPPLYTFWEIIDQVEKEIIVVDIVHLS